MGFVSNQWLGRGIGERNRSYHPVRVELKLSSSRSAWSSGNGAVIQVTATNSAGEYHVLHLTQGEVDEFAETILKKVSGLNLLTLLSATLRGLTNAQLLRVLAFDLRDRVRLPKRKVVASRG